MIVGLNLSSKFLKLHRSMGIFIYSLNNKKKFTFEKKLLGTGLECVLVR